MNDRPILTIISPVYNGEKYISETIESVINSSITYSYEYIVLDDGSNDSTLKILNKYKDKIKIFSHKNIGESATVNRGLENALGEFILVISADDPLLTSDLINKACHILVENPSIVAINSSVVSRAAIKSGSEELVRSVIICSEVFLRLLLLRLILS